MATNQGRVVLFSPGWPPSEYPNGIVTYVHNLREGLFAQGIDSRVVTSEFGGAHRGDDVISLRDARWGRGAMARVRGKATSFWGAYTSPVDRSCRSRAALRALHQHWPYDVFETEETFGMSLIGRPPPGIPVVVRLHGPWFLNGTATGVPRDNLFRWREQLEKWSIERASLVTSPSMDVLQRVREHYNLELPNAQVIPNPVPCVADGDRWHLAGCQPHQILFVGRFDRHKGADVMLDAFSRVASRDSNAELLFVGPDTGLNEDTGRSIGIADYLATRMPEGARARVRVMGAQPQASIEKLRRQAFMTIVPSRYETFSMTTLEAMAFGSPLIAAAAGAIPELVRDGSGVLVPVEDVEALAAAIERLFRDPALAARLGAQAAGDAKRGFSVDSVAKRTLEAYGALTDKFAVERRGSAYADGVSAERW